jgi:hypothetical protein
MQILKSLKSQTRMHTDLVDLHHRMNAAPLVVVRDAAANHNTIERERTDNKLTSVCSKANNHTFTRFSIKSLK